MWANTQCDGRPAEYRWRPLFNAASLSDVHDIVPCSNAAKTRNPLNFAGMPQTPEPVSAVSGPKFAILRQHVKEILLFNKFFPIVDTRLSCEDIADKVVRWCPDGEFSATFFGSCISSKPRAAHFRPAF